MIDSRCKQVSRLGLILLAHLPAFAVASFRAFVRFTVTGIARNFHPCSYDASDEAPRVAAQIHRLFICRNYYRFPRMPCQLWKKPIPSDNPTAWAILLNRFWPGAAVISRSQRIRFPHLCSTRGYSDPGERTRFRRLPAVSRRFHRG